MRLKGDKMYNVIHTLSDCEDLPDLLIDSDALDLSVTRYYNPLDRECSIKSLPNFAEL